MRDGSDASRSGQAAWPGRPGYRHGWAAALVMGVPLLLLLVNTTGLAASDAPADETPWAPPFSLADLSGKSMTLGESIERGPVLLAFWATCCSGMHAAMNQLQRLHEAYADSGLVVLAICEDDNRTLSHVRPWVMARRLSYPVLLDPGGAVMRRYAVSGIPSFILVTPRQRIALTHVGFLPGDEALIERALREQLGLAQPE